MESVSQIPSKETRIPKTELEVKRPRTDVTKVRMWLSILSNSIRGNECRCLQEKEEAFEDNDSLRVSMHS